MFEANGTPGVRIWVAGTRRILGVLQQDDTFHELPLNIRKTWDVASRLHDAALIGDFRVCGREKDVPGRMQLVRVIFARNLVLRLAQ